MLEGIKFRTINCFRSICVIVVDVTKVSQLMWVNQKFKFILGSKCPFYMISSLNLTKE